ncbi:MAG: hypothetical protein AAF730_16620, partial [Bacteroidota bacterium]
MRYRWHLALPLLFVGVLILAACEDTLTPVVGTERPFSMYGLLTAETDTQTVLVVPIREELAPADAATFDAVVRSINLDTGEERIWRDSLVTYQAGTAGRVFYDVFRPTPTQRYRIEVSRADGATSHAEVRIPGEPVATIEEAATFTNIVTQDIVWTSIEEMIELEVDYFVRDFTPGSPLEVFTLEYDGTYDDDAFRVQMALSEDYDEIIKSIPSGRASLLAIRMR